MSNAAAMGNGNLKPCDLLWRAMPALRGLPFVNRGIYYIKLHAWEMDTYAKLSKDTNTGYNLFLYGGYLQTAKNPGDSKAR